MASQDGSSKKASRSEEAESRPNNGSTRDTQKAVCPPSGGNMWKPCCPWPEPPGSKSSSTAHQADNGLSQPLPSMSPFRVTCSSKPPSSLPSYPSPSSALLCTHPWQLFQQPKRVLAHGRAPIKPSRAQGPPTDCTSAASSGPRDGKGTTLDQGPGPLGRTGVGWGSSTIPAAQCQWALPDLRLVPREATEQSPLGHGRAMSGLPEHLHSPSQLLSCVLLAYPGQNSAPSAVWAGLNQPGSEAWSPAALARGRAAALCAEWTRSQHHVACHHARPTHRRGMRRRLNSPGPAYHWLGFLGSHSRSPKREEFSHMGGSQGPEQGERGQREDMS